MKVLLLIPLFIIALLSCNQDHPKQGRLSEITRNFYEIPSFFDIEIVSIDIQSEVLDQNYNCYEYKLDINLKAKEDLLTLRPNRPFGKYRIRTTKGEEFIPITNTKVELEKEIRYYEEQIDQVALISQCVRMRGKKCIRYRKVKASRRHKESMIDRKIASTKKFFPFAINKNQNTIVKELPIVVCKNELTNKWN
ncbi:hypothetical protein ABMA70_03815 [Halobacteriovorax sp. XZX-3]|uniref:hypothetical protein n=1 Tax=unclassified Halobacteriovorax TaxID=2639665 RepID=UPI0037209B06